MVLRYSQPNDDPNDMPWQEAKWLKFHIPGLLFGREVRYLYETANRVGPGRYADLGTFQGLSTGAIAHGIQNYEVDARLWSFDTFEGTGVSSKFITEEGTFEAVHARLKELDVLGPVTFHPGKFSDSVQAYGTFGFDFIFVDGSHDYESVREDFDNWSPLLNVGGEMAFHDSNIKSPNKQVWKLMEELPDLGDWEKVAEERTLTAWIKKS